MLGKILGYEVNGNLILVNYKDIQCTVTMVNERVVNFFAPFFRKERNSKAVEILKLIYLNQMEKHYVETLGEKENLLED